MNSSKSYYRTRCCTAIVSGLIVPIMASAPMAEAQGPASQPAQSGQFTLPAPAGSPPLRTPTANPSPAQNGAAPTSGNVEARLQIYDVPLDHVGTVAAKLQLQFGADKRVRITNDPATGRLMVLAPENTQLQIGQAVEAVRKQVGSLNMDGRGNVVPSTVQQNQYKLKRATWRELEDAIGRLAGPRLTITTSNNGELAQLKLVGKDVQQEVMQVDRRNDEVRLQGTPANVFAWTQVVTAIDVGQVDPARPTQIIPITPASPERIEKALKLVKLASYQQNVQEDQATGSARMPVNGDDKATAIGSPDALSSGSGLIGDVDISFVPEMGLVIVKGTKKDVQRVLEVIEQIKKQSIDTAPDIELLPLRHVNSQALAAIIKDLNEEVFSKRQGQVSITALGQPNSLLLIGRPEALESIKALIGKLDQPLDPNSQLRVYKFVNSSAVDAETLIKNFFGDPTTTTGAQTTANQSTTTLIPRVKAVADYRTNSLLVQASPRDQAEVARLVKEIDANDISTESEIKVFPIKYAIAAELEPILKTAISGENSTSTSNSGGNQQQQQQGGNNSSGSSKSSVPNSRLTIIPRKGDGELVDSGLLTGVVVTTNPSINALIIRAPSKSMALIKALIDQLDQPASIDARIKVFEVKNGDASSLATTLQQAFGLPTTGTTGNNNAGNNGLQGLFGLQNQAGGFGSSESSLVPLRIATEIRTNSIIVSGSQADLDVMEVLLLRLDEDNARQRNTEVIWLRNSSAVDVANAITTLINNQRTALTSIQPVQVAGQATGQIFSVNERIEREVFVVAEPATNSLIISAMPRYMQMIRQVIERLDRQQPMIAVEILIAEVTLDDSFDFGTELGLQDALLFDRNSASGGTLNSPGFNVNGTPFGITTPAAQQKLPGNVAGQGSSGFGLSRTNSTLGYGGLVLAAGSQSVNMLFRALQDANRVQILSRPQLMTVDGNIASVQVGSKVPRIGGTTVTTGISQQNISDVPVGLIMQIQPRTNQDGLINMIVAITRSSLGPTDTGVPIGFAANGDVIRSPIINTTQAQTRVTAYDGQTVVLSGLITKNKTSRSRRVPWLADIPIAGALFRFDSDTESRTELLVVMTPRVINYNDNEKLEMIKHVESSRMSYCMADILNIHGDVGLSNGNGLWGPAASPVIYPDIEPTVPPQARGPQYLTPSQPEYMNDNMQLNGDPNAQEDFSINAPVRSNINGGKTLIKSGKGNLSQPTVNSASPIQNSSYQTGTQQGSNGVTPASYQPLSQPPQNRP